MPERDAADTFRFTPTGRRRLAKLALRLGMTKKQALETAVTHTLATLESHDPRLWPVVPSEPQESFEEDAG